MIQIDLHTKAVTLGIKYHINNFPNAKALKMI